MITFSGFISEKCHEIQCFMSFTSFPRKRDIIVNLRYLTRALIDLQSLTFLFLKKQGCVTPTPNDNGVPTGEGHIPHPDRMEKKGNTRKARREK